MKIGVFAKKRTSRDNRPFTSYIGRLVKKDKTEVTVSINFREECGAPKPEQCPMFIEVEKKDANLVIKEVVKEDTGDVITSRVLWVSKWKPAGEFIDHSLDEYE